MELGAEKVSLLVTEAYKEAHQKSVQVSHFQFCFIWWIGILPIFLFHLYHNLQIDISFFNPGYEREDEQSCPKPRNATKSLSQMI